MELKSDTENCQRRLLLFEEKINFHSRIFSLFEFLCLLICYLIELLVIFFVNIFNENIFLFRVQKLFTVKSLVRLEKWRHCISIFIYAKHVSILILNRLVVSIHLASQIKANPSICEYFLVSTAIWLDEMSDMKVQRTT